MMGLLEIFPPGKYYIGDCCYVLDDDVYHDVWGKQYNYQNGTFECNGKRVAVGSTGLGDGTFRGSDHIDYCIDSGTLSMVPFELCTKCSEDEAKELGAVYTFDSEIQFHSYRGIFEVASNGFYVRIDTTTFAPDDTDEEEGEEDAQEETEEDDEVAEEEEDEVEEEEDDDEDHEGNEDALDDLSENIDMHSEAQKYARELLHVCDEDLANALRALLNVHKKK